MNETSDNSESGTGQGASGGQPLKDRSLPGQKGAERADGAPFRLGNLDVDEYLADPARKQQFVTPMFDVIAPRYDAFTRLFSFGMDAGWKRNVIDEAIRRGQHATTAIDLACGTGDFVFALANGLPRISVTGIDASPRMIEFAARRLEQTSVPPTQRTRMTVRVGDMMQLEAANQGVDLITAGYGVRNVPDARVAVREMARVLKPGGTLITLDFYRPQLALWRALLLGYLSVAGNLVGWWWHRDAVVYGYISKSIDHFMSWQAFSALLEEEGFTVNRVERHLGGGIAMHVATKR